MSGKVRARRPELDGPGGGARVRVDLPNPGLRLRPGRATLHLRGPARAALAVAGQRCLMRGQPGVVFVAAVAASCGDRWRSARELPTDVEIVSGLAAGERIATSGRPARDGRSRCRRIARGREPDALLGRVVEASARRRGLVITVWLAAALAAASLPRLRLDALPDLSSRRSWW